MNISIVGDQIPNPQILKYYLPVEYLWNIYWKQNFQNIQKIPSVVILQEKKIRKKSVSIQNRTHTQKKENKKTLT